MEPQNIFGSKDTHGIFMVPPFKKKVKFRCAINRSEHFVDLSQRSVKFRHTQVLTRRLDLSPATSILYIIL